MKKYIARFNELLVDYAPKVLTALVILIVGLFVISLIVRFAKRLMNKRGLELSLQKFLGNLLGWSLKIVLFVTVIAKLGVETTSFAAVLAAAGLAIGLALQGSLSNFAGGALIMIFKPFKLGDYISTQGEEGTVKEIEIFTTKLTTLDSKEVIIPNGVLSNGNIINYSAEPTRRINFTFGVSYDSNLKQTKEVLMQVLTSHPKILKEPAPLVTVLKLNDSSVDFAVRPWVLNEDYWDVFFDINEQTKEALDAAGIEIPYPHRVEIQKKS